MHLIAIVVAISAVALTISKCSVIQPTARIIGGTEAANINLSWTVSLSNYGWHNCGGSVINKRTILTAAHCLYYVSARGLRVLVGSKQRSSGGISVPVQQILYHKQFDIATMDYDIGMVRLAEDLQFSDEVQPITLPKYQETVNPGTKAIVAGWGFKSVLGPAVDYLRYAIVPIVSHETCNKLLGDISDRMICAGYMEGGVDACALDSGGPLIVNAKLIGIVSWGIGCAAKNQPGVYTRVSELIPWIEEQLAAYNEQL